MKKRLLSLLLCALMVFTSVPTTDVRASETNVLDLQTSDATFADALKIMFTKDNRVYVGQRVEWNDYDNDRDPKEDDNHYTC